MAASAAHRHRVSWNAKCDKNMIHSSARVTIAAIPILDQSDLDSRICGLGYTDRRVESRTSSLDCMLPSSSQSRAVGSGDLPYTKLLPSSLDCYGFGQLSLDIDW